MKKTVLLIMLIGLLYPIKAQNSSDIEVTNEDVKITTGNNGKAYYNDKEIATKEDVEVGIIDLGNTTLANEVSFLKNGITREGV